MRRAVILHGTDGKPDSNWFRWLKNKFEVEGYNVWVPQLPNSHAPNKDTYNNFLLAGDFDLTDAIVVGHSSGAVEVLNLLMDERCPKIRLGVMVSAWEHGVPAGMDYEQFEYLFPTGGFDFPFIRSNAKTLAFVHAAKDPYCPLDQARHLAERTGASLTVLDVESHLGADYAEFPELWDIIKPVIAIN